MRNNLYYIFFLIFTLIFLHIITGELILTGDEPRYLYSSVSFWKTGTLQLSNDAWMLWQRENGLSGDIPAGHGIHSVIHSLLISPAIGTLDSLSSGRWMHVFIGTTPLLLLLRKYPMGWGLDIYIWLAIYYLSIPIFPYLRLLYPEIWLFCIFSIVLILLADDHPSKTNAWLVFFLALALPFFHIRMILVAAGCLIYLAYKVKALNILKNSEILIAICLLCIAAVLFIRYNMFISGGWLSASAAFSPSFALFIDRLAIQLFSFRHGVVLYSPVFLLGFTGLAIGITRRQPFISFCAILLALYLCTFVWGSASESYTARFWVAITPVIIIGTVYYWRSAQNFSRYLIALPLVAITIINGSIFIENGNIFLANRFGSSSYDYVYHTLSAIFGKGIHFDIIALTDPFDFSHPGPDGRPSIFHFMTVLTATLLAIYFSTSRRLFIPFLAAVTFSLIFTIILNKTLFSEISQDKYSISQGVNEKMQSYLRIIFNNAGDLDAIKIGEFMDFPLWGISKDSPKSFILTGHYLSGEEIPPSVIGGRQLIRLNLNKEKIYDLTLTATEAEATASWLGLKISLLTLGFWRS